MPTTLNKSENQKVFSDNTKKQIIQNIETTEE